MEDKNIELLSLIPQCERLFQSSSPSYKVCVKGFLKLWLQMISSTCQMSNRQASKWSQRLQRCHCMYCILIQRWTINEFENNFFKALVRVGVLHALAFILTLHCTMGKYYLKCGSFVFKNLAHLKFFLLICIQCQNLIFEYQKVSVRKF